MPHFPSIQKKSICCFEELKKYDHCIIKPTQQVRETLICSEWPTMQHIYASILKGETDQSATIQILSSHEYHSTTKEALWEYDNILKSLYILNYIDDIKTRQAVRAALNRGEAYHQLCRAIAFMNGGRLRGITELELELWNECARLIASAVIFYNAYILSLLLERTIDDKLIEVLLRLSPVGWSHLSFLGEYKFDRQRLGLEIQKWLKNLKIDSTEFIYSK
jgi:TnpA family transposase